MDRIDQLRIFVRVAHSGSFALAANQLDLPRPTVSLAIRQLEGRLGTRLFNRTTRRVSLTQDGIALMERAPTLIADTEALEAQFRSAGDTLQGRLRVDVPSRIARRLVVPALPDFFAGHPGVELDLGSSDRPVDLVQEGIDLALRVGTNAASSLVSRPVGQLRLVNCASPAYLARRGTPQVPADLAQHQAVNYTLTGSGRAAAWEWYEAGALHSLPLPGLVSVNNAESYIACCLAGLGLIQIPAFDVAEHLAGGELVEVLQAWPVPPMPVQLVYPHRRNLSPRLRAFNDWLVGVIQPSCEPRDGGSGSGLRV